MLGTTSCLSRKKRAMCFSRSGFGGGTVNGSWRYRKYHRCTNHAPSIVQYSVAKSGRNTHIHGSTRNGASRSRHKTNGPPKHQYPQKPATNESHGCGAHHRDTRDKRG